MTPSPSAPEYVLTLSCRDVRGIVAAVSGFIAAIDGFIIESTQFGDPTTDKFFLRMHFSAGPATPIHEEVESQFASEVASAFAMKWDLHDCQRKPRVVIMVSKFDHCLHDLLYRFRSGWFDIDITAVISNHNDLRALVESYGIAFHCFPMQDDKAQQEAKVWSVIEALHTDLVVLARYMQILSPELSAKLSGRAINIHHSFLPSFKGARPYHQAHARGVKLIGATAHYVTDDLDEGPIIEQEVERVDHTLSPEHLVAVGNDIERVVLARAVKYHCEQRVLLNGNKTVVFT
ncbi:MAG: formyltetrahydrofolate deformylase [Rickettsiales bacterium]|nr:formyltetrahydrofolate deformylase [Rickettsiales bacterium]